MVRLSDFTWPTANPPAVIETPIQAEIAKQRIPGRLGNILQHMGTDNMKLTVAGNLYATISDTDKHQTDYEDLLALLVSKEPMSFNHSAFARFGADGDNISEATTGWTASNMTLATEGTIKKVGDYSLKITDLGGGDEDLRHDFTAVNCNLPIYSSLCFWLRVHAITADNDIKIQLENSNGHYFMYVIDVSSYMGGWTADTWKECIIPLGDCTSLTWTESGTPTWSAITRLVYQWTGAASDTVYMDGISITNAVMVSASSQLRYPPGRPHVLNYKLDLEQYYQ